jgi:molecular chaperone DnaK (HSP70)
MADIAIGIDLGTSNSCVAVVRHGAAEVLPNA